MGLGEGIAITDLYSLLTSIREQPQLTLDVKILDNPWTAVSVVAIKQMILAIKSGKIQKEQDIRLRLYAKP